MSYSLRRSTSSVTLKMRPSDTSPSLRTAQQDQLLSTLRLILKKTPLSTTQISMVCSALALAMSEERHSYLAKVRWGANGFVFTLETFYDQGRSLGRTSSLTELGSTLL